MKNKIQKTSPKKSTETGEGSPLAGAVVAQYVRCGKPGCRCTRGELHGPYYYRFVRQGKRRRKFYVRLSDADQTKARCQAWRESKRNVRETLRACREASAAMNRYLRAVKALQRIGNND